jgi:methyl-accepting chemotaxis protein
MLPLFTVAIVSFTTANGTFSDLSGEGKNALEEANYDKLNTALSLKKGQINEYFTAREDDAVSIGQVTKYIKDDVSTNMESIGTIQSDRIQQYFNERIGDAEALGEMTDYNILSSYDKMYSISGQKVDQIEDYLDDLSTLTENFASNALVINSLESFENAMIADGLPADTNSGSEWTNSTETWGIMLDRITNDFDLHDIFLISHDGHVLYTTSRESDLGEDLVNGSLRNEGLGLAYTEAKESINGFSTIDYMEYSPSGGKPAAFMACQVFDFEGSPHGVFAIQIPTDKINEIMTTTEGMGLTGEAYLVSLDDNLMRSDSRFSSESTILKRRIDTYATQHATKTRTCSIYKDYRGIPVLGCYKKLEVEGLNWILASEIDQVEALTPTTSTGDYFTHYCEIYGYYDLFLINPDGYVYFTVFEEADYQTNLQTGPYKDTNLADLFRQALHSDEALISDFEYYEPSSAPAAFIAVPVKYNGIVETVVALQVNVQQINNIMGSVEGLGNSGESYLVSLDDNLMRSDSKFSNTSTILDSDYEIDTHATRTVSNNVQTAIYPDYRGISVLGVFRKLDIKGLNWAVITEMDQEEAFTPKTEDGEYFQLYIEEYGYYDLFLINPDGYIFYTVTKEADYHTNLDTGKFKDTNLGKIFKKCLQEKRIVFADYEYYGPSNEQAAFITSPILEDGEVSMIVALQLNTNQVNTIMTEATGMGESGETYLVGPDFLMRSDSRFNDGSSSDIKVTSIYSESSRKGLEGENGHQSIVDYRGVKVLSAYDSISFFNGDLNWAIIGEIDEEEAFNSANDMEKSGHEATLTMLSIIIPVVLAAGIIAVIISLLFARSITKPISNLVGISKKLADGDFSVKMNMKKSRDEIGEMVQAYSDMLDNTSIPLQQIDATSAAIADGDLTKDVEIEAKGDIARIVSSFKKMQLNLRDLVKDIQKASTDVATISQEMASMTEEMNASTEQVSAAITQISEGAQQQAQQATDTTMAMQEMLKSVEDVANSSNLSAETAIKTNESARKGRETVKETVQKMSQIQAVVIESAKTIEDLSKKSTEIVQIVDVITDITDQTTLLALNAAIEAARAGDQGRGFAVVADEVKKRAENSRESAENIAKMIKEIESETQKAVEAMRKGTTAVEEGMSSIHETDSALGEIAEMAEDTSGKVQEISAATQLQRAGAEEAVTSMETIASVAEESASSTEESSASTEELTASMEELTARAQDLSEMALSLQESAGRFKLSTEEGEVE